jgi:CRP-like cAMP-binding protein
MKECHLLYKSSNKCKLAKSIYSSIGKQQDVERFKILLGYAESSKRAKSCVKETEIKHNSYILNSLNPIDTIEQSKIAHLRYKRDSPQKRPSLTRSDHRIINRSLQKNCEPVIQSRQNKSAWKKISFYYHRITESRPSIASAISEPVHDVHKHSSSTSSAIPDKFQFSNPASVNRSPIGNYKAQYENLKRKLIRNIDFVSNRDLEIPQVNDATEFTIGCSLAANKHKLMRSSEDVEYLKKFLDKIDYLKEMDYKVRDMCVNGLSIVKYNAGQMIIEKGDDCNKVILICQGKIEKRGMSTELLARGVLIGAHKCGYGKKSSSTYIAAEDSRCLVLDINTIQTFKNKVTAENEREGLHSLSMCDLLLAWPHNRIAQLYKSTVKRYYPPNAIIYDIETNADFVYVLSTGNVNIDVLSHTDLLHKYPVGVKKWGLSIHRKLLLSKYKTVTEKQLFGYEEVLRMCPRETKATTTCQSVIYQIDAAVFKGMLNQVEINDLQNKSVISDCTPISNEVHNSILENRMKVDNLYRSKRFMTH